MYRREKTNLAKESASWYNKMDYQRKKQLTQSVGYLQANLVIGPEFIESIKAKGLFTNEELMTIQKDDMNSGKVIELVCKLKGRDTRTINKFLEILDENDYEDIANVLRNNINYAESKILDPRAYNFLERCLNGIAVPARTIEDIGALLIPKELYQDDVLMLKDKIEHMHRQLQQSKLYMPPNREGTQTSMSCESQGSGSGSSDRDPTEVGKAVFFGREVPQWDVPTKEEDFELLLRQKDEIIKRKDQEYMKLRKILDDTQKDLQGVLDLNSQYLNIISQLNQLQGIGAPIQANLGEKSSEIMEMEGKLDESRARIEQLRRELIVKEDDLHLKNREMEKAQRKEVKFKEMLGLEEDADDATVESTVRRLQEEGKMHRSELLKIAKELKQSMVQRAKLEDQVTSLTRDKEKIEFHMRQQDLAIKKMNRIRTGSDAIKKAEQSITAANERIAAQLLKLPAIERAGSSLSLSSTSKLRGIQQFCMFCRQEFQPLKGLTCRVHFRPIRRGKWSCCEDECHRSAGCMQVPHFYIEVTVDRKIFITDGARYMELT